MDLNEKAPEMDDIGIRIWLFHDKKEKMCNTTAYWCEEIWQPEMNAQKARPGMAF